MPPTLNVPTKQEGSEEVKAKNSLTTYLEKYQVQKYARIKGILTTKCPT